MNKDDMDPWERACAEQLKAELENSARTLGDIAKSAGLSTKTLSRYGSGERSPSIYDLRRVLAAIPVDLNVFLRRVDQRAEDL